MQNVSTLSKYFYVQLGQCPVYLFDYINFKIFFETRSIPQQNKLYELYNK